MNGKGWSTLALEARGLPRARAGERYVVWLSSERGSYSVGTLEVTNGWVNAVLHSPRTVAPGSLVEISLVRSGGHEYTPLVEGTLPS